ncbi:MAG TPA: hypothetical protein VGK00_12195 [Anaerolineales bacterium]|jgi:hypothetical protein
MSKFRNYYQARLKNYDLPGWAAPVLLFITCFFTFGVLLTRLGFFQDDWHHVYYAYTEGVDGLRRFLFTDSRPLSFIVYAPFFKFLGFAPANWHWSLMLLRFLTVLSFWVSIRLVWPNLTGLAAWVGLFFAIYPAYPLQSLSVTYTLHWVLYLVFMLSLVLMLLASRRPKAYLPLTCLAILLQIFHLLMIEYYAGLELARLVFLWFVFREMPSNQRWRKVTSQWLPYLLVLVLYAVYRLSYGALYGYDRFAPDLLIEIIHSPLVGLRTFLQIILQDVTHVLVSPWYTTLDPANIDLARSSSLAIMLGTLGFALISYFVVAHLERSTTDAPNKEAREIVIGGSLVLFFSLLPSWLAGLYLFSKNPLWSGRLALPALIGASMILTGSVYWLIEKPVYRHLVLSILLGLAVGFHMQTARDFQVSWDKQLQFYWQLYWRAPALKTNTLIVADAEILPYMGYYPTAFAINMLYSQPMGASQSVGKADFWFNAGSEHINMTDLGLGLPAEFSKYSTTFSATQKEIVSINFEPQEQRCLWVLRPSYEEVRFLSSEAYRWMSKSNLDRILPQSNSAPQTAIFGTEPQHTWCYYYEKADLASQQGDWQAIIGFWDEASSKGFRPATSVELLPFVEAFARTGSWDTARQLTYNANVYPPRAPSLLCSLWKNLEKTTSSSEQRTKALKLIVDKLECQE